MGTFLIDTEYKMSKKEKEYWENYHLLHNHQWEEYIVKNGPKVIELMTAKRKMVDRITEDDIEKDERVLVIRGVLNHTTTLSLKNLKKYGNWEKIKATLLEMIDEVDGMEVEKGPTLEEIDKECKKYRELMEK